MSRYLSFRQQRELLVTGRRRTPVRIEQRPSADIVDPGGIPTEEGQWTTLSDPEWMAREDLGAQEVFDAHQESAQVDTVWVMAYRSDMDPDDPDNNVAKLRRLKHRNRIYDITGGAIIGNYEGIELQTLGRSGA